MDETYSSTEEPIEEPMDPGMDAAPLMDGAPVDALPDALPDAAPPAVSFVLKNDGTTDLSFAVDKGWQPVLFAYSGKPPKAKSILIFPKGCTQSCEAPLEEICPRCEFEDDLRKRRQQEREETKREIVPGGGQVAVPWDGRVFVYEKVAKDIRKASKSPKCECYRMAEPDAGEYTVKACGFRPPKEIGNPNRVQCAETTMTLPFAATPATVTISFPPGN